MQIIELKEQRWVETPKGIGLAIAWLDYGQDSDCFWKVVLQDSGEVWDVPQYQIKMYPNWSMDRRR